MWVKSTDKNQLEDILQSRGFDLQQLLKDTKKYHIANLTKAAVILKQNLHRFIYVVADYDCDGIMSALILDLILKQLGANYQIRFPRRMSEGYGISKKIVKEIPANSLVITVDNGIAAVEALEEAKKKNCPIIILDHHMRRDDGLLPDADVIVDPHVFAEPEDFTDYCGAGLSYQFSKEFDFPQQLYWKAKVYAAIATIADVVSLTEDNRVIVKDGLLLLNKKAADLPILYQLITAMRLPLQADYTDLREKDKLAYLCSRFTETHVGFQIAPCINAMGRLYDNGAEKVFQVLSGRIKDISSGIEEMIETNNKRKAIKQEQFEVLSQTVHITDKDRVVIAYAPCLQEGIVGLNAATFVEQYARPAIVLTDAEEEGVLKGSARSTPDINIKLLLDRVSDLLVGFGGHAGAAGLQVKKNRLEDLRKVLNAICPSSEMLTQVKTYDITVTESNIVKAYLNIIKYAPYGEGFPAPIVQFKGSLSRPHRLIKDIGISFTSGQVGICSFDTSVRDRFVKDPVVEDLTFYGTLEYSTFSKAPQVMAVDAEFGKEKKKTEKDGV